MVKKAHYGHDSSGGTLSLSLSGLGIALVISEHSAVGIYTYVHVTTVMAHKTLSISEEAYNALARVKGKDESFTKVILRLAQRRSSGDLLDYIRSVGPNEELASAIEKVLEKRKSIQLRAAGR